MFTKHFTTSTTGGVYKPPVVNNEYLTVDMTNVLIRELSMNFLDLLEMVVVTFIEANVKTNDHSDIHSENFRKYITSSVIQNYFKENLSDVVRQFTTPDLLYFPFNSTDSRLTGLRRNEAINNVYGSRAVEGFLDEYYHFLQMSLKDPFQLNTYQGYHRISLLSKYKLQCIDGIIYLHKNDEIQILGGTLIKKSSILETFLSEVWKDIGRDAGYLRISYLISDLSINFITKARFESIKNRIISDYSYSSPETTIVNRGSTGFLENLQRITFVNNKLLLNKKDYNLKKFKLNLITFCKTYVSLKIEYLDNIEDLITDPLQEAEHIKFRSISSKKEYLKSLLKDSEHMARYIGTVSRGEQNAIKGLIL